MRCTGISTQERLAAQAYNTRERLAAQAYNTQEREAAQDWSVAQTESLWNREDTLRNEANQREDTALTRTVADAKNAGLSPLAVLGSGTAGNVANVNSGVVSPSSSASIAPAHSAGSIAPSTANPATWSAAPMDLSSFIGAMSSQKNIDEITRHNKEAEAIEREKIQSAETIENDKLLVQSDLMMEQLKQEDDHFMLNYYQSASQYSAQLAQNKEFHLDQMKREDRKQAWIEIDSQNNQNIDMTKDFCKSLDMRYYIYPVTDEAQYNRDMNDLKNLIMKGNRGVLNYDERNPDFFRQSESESTTQSQSNSASASGSPVPQYLGNNSASASKSNLQSDSISVTQSDRLIKEKISSMYGGVIGVPVLVKSLGDYYKYYKGK